MSHRIPKMILLIFCLMLQAGCRLPAVVSTYSPTFPPPSATAFTPSPTPLPVTVTPAPSITLEVLLPKPTRRPSATPQVTETPETDFGVIAREHLRALSEEIGARPVDSDQEAEAADYIEKTFQSNGYAPYRQPFSFKGEYAASMDSYKSVNLIAVKEGLSKRELIVGAHYDSVKNGEGADDNASGVAVMLEVAERVKDVSTPYTIRFIAFGAEEEGLYGSDYYVSQMSSSEIKNTVGMINLDSLIAGDLAYVYGDAGRAGVIRDWIMGYADSHGFEIETEPGDNLDDEDGTPCECSDYSAFEAEGIPFAYFEATDWTLGEKDGETQVDETYGKDGVIRHSRYDTVQYIERSFPGRIDAYLKLFSSLLYATLVAYQ